MTTKKYCVFITALVMTIGALGQDSLHNFQCGDEFTDLRDRQIYSTILIGDQCWMAENLNIGIMIQDFKQTSNGVIEKTCYDNNSQNCNTYGGLYTWYEAMNWTAEDNSQGICPVGWHLPSRSEWEELVGFLGPKDAGQQMKATREHSPAWDGTNSSGFNALPAGVGYKSSFGRIDKWAIFWSSTLMVGGPLGRAHATVRSAPPDPWGGRSGRIVLGANVLRLG